MSIGRNTVLILSILLISKCITYSWSKTHRISSVHNLVKRGEFELFQEEPKV